MKWSLLDKPSDEPRKVWLRCECGTERLVLRQGFTSGKSSSCGCVRKQSRRLERTDLSTEVGTRFGKLTYLGCSPTNSVRSRGVVLCDCGNKKTVNLSQIINGSVISCGCFKATKHGLCGSRQYHTWQGMVARCTNPNKKSYKHYGARGITVCDRWRLFENFWEDVKDIYQDDLTIERIDSNKGYEPGNVRFATYSEQNRNKRYPKPKSGCRGLDRAGNTWTVRVRHDTGVFNQHGIRCKLEAVMIYHQKYLELVGVEPSYLMMT